MCIDSVAPWKRKMSELTPVQQYYKDKTVFITGASGFMGKVLLEKLLYSCQDLKEIIILCRPKKGRTPASRLEDMWKLPIFQRIKAEKPHVLEKVTVFQGDVTDELLGLSEEDLTHIADNTNIVFHIAALLKMEGSLAESVDMNICGTKRAIEVGRKMKNLEAFVHVSTTFCNCEEDVVYEKVYDYHQKPEDIISLTEWMDAKSLEILTPALMAPHPNNYTYTKRMAELFVRDQYETMPVIIARPSIVTPAFQEPLPGWVDNMNGMVGILVAIGKGALRSFMCAVDVKVETIPVDISINGMILIPYHVSQNKIRSAEIPVYNLTLSEEVKQTSRWLMEKGFKINEQYPISYPMWYPNVTITLNKFYHWLNVILFMWLPALLIDGLMTIFGQRRFMMRTHKRIMAGLSVLQFFTTTTWNFKCDNFKSIAKTLSPEDMKLFKVNELTEHNMEEYYLNSCLGTRTYLMKEPIENLPKAKFIFKVMYIVDRMWKTFLCGLFFYWLCSTFSLMDYARDMNPAHLFVTMKRIEITITEM